MTYKDLSKSLRASYKDLDPISKKYPLEFDENDVLRFKGNPAVRAMYDRSPCMNELWQESARNKWDREDMKMLYRLMGYSLSGFLEVFWEDHA